MVLIVCAFPKINGFLFRSSSVRFHSRQASNFSNLNKYAAFRQKYISLHSIYRDEIHYNYDIESKGLELAERAVNLLAQKGRTWDRLSPLVSLALKHIKPNDRGKLSIADVGCDHGLLSIALAATGSFYRVVGSDISHRALTDGALAFNEKVLSILDRDGIIGTESQIRNLQFRTGDGLECLHSRDVDGGICIAGMGVDSMLDILNFNKLELLQCRNLFLQPPTSKPRRLMELYRPLQTNGWDLVDERINRINNRWYISSAFQRSENTNSQDDILKFPGYHLSNFTFGNSTSAQQQDWEEFQKYIQFHLKWIHDDMVRGKVSEDEEAWRSLYISDKFKGAITRDSYQI